MGQTEISSGGRSLLNLMVPECCTLCIDLRKKCSIEIWEKLVIVILSLFVYKEGTATRSCYFKVLSVTVNYFNSNWKEICLCWAWAIFEQLD